MIGCGSEKEPSAGEAGEAGAIFLLIPPDARGIALGQTGVATSPDSKSLHWNMAKLSFLGEMDRTQVKSERPDFGISQSYSSWLPNLDINYWYSSGYKVLNDKQAFAGDLKFIDLGTVQERDSSGKEIEEYNSFTVSSGLGFSQKLSDKLSGGLAGKYVYQKLSESTEGNEFDGGNSSSVLADVSIFYTNPDFKIGGKDTRLNIGMNVSNIGPKIKISGVDDYGDPPPFNLKLGTALSVYLDKYNELTFSTDLNNLLVPLAEGPKIKDIISGAGLEYVYANKFALRSGFYNDNGGNVKSFNIGIGGKFKLFSIDYSYIMSGKGHPRDGTTNFTLNINM